MARILMALIWLCGHCFVLALIQVLTADTDLQSCQTEETNTYTRGHRRPRPLSNSLFAIKYRSRVTHLQAWLDEVDHGLFTERIGQVPLEPDPVEMGLMEVDKFLVLPLHLHPGLLQEILGARRGHDYDDVHAAQVLLQGLVQEWLRLAEGWV